MVNALQGSYRGIQRSHNGGFMKRSYTKTDKKGREETWEWEETPEVIAALEQLRATERLHEDMKNAGTKLATPQQEGTKTPLKAPNASPSKSKG